MVENAKSKELGEKINLLDNVDFEVMPTQKAVGLIEKIPISSNIRVTCRPTGYEEGTSFFEKLNDNTKNRTVLHLAAARVRSGKDMDNLANNTKALGLKKVFLVRGDGNLGCENFSDTLSLIQGFYERGIEFEKIDIAGHPEGNPYDLHTTETLLRKQDLAEKLGIEMEVITQMCFDEERYIDWLIEIRERGVYLPVRVGILGKVKWDTFLKVLESLGVGDVWAFLKSKPKMAMQIAEYSVVGYSPELFLKSLEESGISELGTAGVSVFTLGNISASVDEIERLKRK